MYKNFIRTNICKNYFPCLLHNVNYLGQADAYQCSELIKVETFHNYNKQCSFNIISIMFRIKFVLEGAQANIKIWCFKN